MNVRRSIAPAEDAVDLISCLSGRGVGIFDTNHFAGEDNMPRSFPIL